IDEQPGQYPFTRGIQPTMYRGRLWTMRQYAGFGTAAESNRRYHYLLGQGVSGLSVAFDLPTQMGYDSDHALAQGEVGRVGVAIDSLADMDELFAGIPLGGVSTSMTINATAVILLALYIAVARKQGVETGRLSGTIQNDILKEYVARGTYIYPPRASLRIVTDIFAYCDRELPNWNTISISGNPLREAPLVLLQCPQRFPRGDRQVPRGAAAVGHDHARPFRRHQPARAAVALPHPDRGQHADRAAAGQK